MLIDVNTPVDLNPHLTPTIPKFQKNKIKIRIKTTTLKKRAQARTAKKGPKKDDGLTPEQRRERDAKALQEKTARKAKADCALAVGNAGAKGIKK